MGTYGKLLKKHYVPPQKQEVIPQEPDHKEQPIIPNEQELSPVPPVPRTPSTPERDVPPVLPVPPAKRLMKQRHPFDIYLDQYQALKQIADDERRQGGIGSMSAMVRDAIDTIIATKSKKK